MHRPRRGLFVALLGALIVLPGCFPGWPPEDQPDRIGLELSSDGSRVTVLYPNCPGVLIRSVQLSPAGAQPLWRISSSPGSELREFVVGRTPANFTEAVPFSGGLPAGDYLLILDNTARTGETEYFRTGQLERGKVLVGHDTHLSRAEYQARQGVC